MEATLTFDNQGLVPVVIQDDATDEVLMVASMNEEALRLTRETGYTHLFSRSRQKFWRKGEQSGNTQEVRAIFVNCEQNSLLVRVVQHGGAACHDGYHSCYYRRLQPDNTLQIVAERVFDPAVVYASASNKTTDDNSVFQIDQDALPVEPLQKLEAKMRQLYGVYLYLRDHDMSEESNGVHMHTGRTSDTILEGSQVGYWLLLLAATCNVPYNAFVPHAALLSGYYQLFSEGKAIEIREECLQLTSADEPSQIARGLQLGFALIGWACAEAKVDPLEPAEYDLGQMRRKGLVK